MSPTPTTALSCYILVLFHVHGYLPLAVRAGCVASRLRTGLGQKACQNSSFPANKEPHAHLLPSFWAEFPAWL